MSDDFGDFFAFIGAGIFVGVLIGLLIIWLYVGGTILTHEQIGNLVCNSNDADLLKVEDNGDRVLCIKDSRVIVFEDLRGD